MKSFRPSDEMPIELLAAYVDGELSDDRCAEVEAWLAEHPEAHTDLFEQREMSRENKEFWDAVEPPMPSETAWDRAYNQIQNRLIKPAMPVRARRRTSWYLAPVFALAGMAATLLVVVAMTQNAPNLVKSVPSIAMTANDGDDNEEVYRLATADDVEIIQLPEEASSLIVVGQHPMLDTPILLATTSDLDIFSLGPDDDGHMPNVELIAGPNAPMLVAQTPRR